MLHITHQEDFQHFGLPGSRGAVTTRLHVKGGFDFEGRSHLSQPT